MSNELGAFLRSRRARLRPEEVGLGGGGRRRVAGLRREEVAVLASVSTDYVVRLEQGRLRPSDAALEALARALRLDPVERTHLFALVGRAAPAVNHRTTVDEVRPALLRLLRAVEPSPAYVVGPTLDLLAWNSTASMLFGGLEARTPAELNVARLIFLDSGVRQLIAPEQVGLDVVAALRAAQGRRGSDPRVDLLVDELRERSSDFRALWTTQDVAAKTHGCKTFVHPQVGRLDLEWERLSIPGETSQALMVYSAEPGTASATALTLLGSLAATEARMR